MGGRGYLERTLRFDHCKLEIGVFFVSWWLGAKGWTRGGGGVGVEGSFKNSRSIEKTFNYDSMGNNRSQSYVPIINANVEKLLLKLTYLSFQKTELSF